MRLIDKVLGKKSESTEPEEESFEKKESIDLDKKVEVFSSIPRYKRKRIFGCENEFGIVNPQWCKLPKTGFIQNGGRIYKDCGHIEYASPEVRNPLEIVIFEKAGELLSQDFADKIYKNNVDSEGNTFGAHENYFTKADLYQLKSIIPFLITRQIFAGSGKLDEYYGSFLISQLASYMRYAIGDSTTRDRAILCTKDESLSGLNGWHRLHLILGDANMCESALFLKFGTTGLVLDLAEDRELPEIKYDLDYAVYDIKNISRQTKEWFVKGMYDETGCGHVSTKAVDVQKKYFQAADKLYSGRDIITDLILDMWIDTLEKLEDNPLELVGRVDWVTKKALIDAYAAKHGLDMSNSLLRNIDLQYHDVNRDTGLFYALERAGKTEKLVSNKLIREATKNPPKDTRAYIRGTIIKANNKGNGETAFTVSWESCGEGKVSICSGCEQHCQTVKVNPDSKISLPNPFKNYASKLEKIKKKLRESE